MSEMFKKLAESIFDSEAFDDEEVSLDEFKGSIVRLIDWLKSKGFSSDAVIDCLKYVLADEEN